MGNGVKYHLAAMDFESSGVLIESKKHQPISCGLILVDFDTLEEIDSIYVECAMEYKSEWTIGAEKCHGMTYDYIMEQQSMADAATKIFEFLIRNDVKSLDYIMPIGHNVAFDVDCLNAWMDHIDVKLKIMHRRADTFPMGFGLLGAMNSDELFDFVDVTRDTHNALEDARAALNVVRMCRKIGKFYLEHHPKD